MAQRLVRKLCQNCKEPDELTEAEMRALRIDASQLSEATIMKGRRLRQMPASSATAAAWASSRFSSIDDEVRFMINDRASTLQLRKRARELGMRTLREDGVRKVLAGLTTAEEVIAATMGDAD